jgi:competence protein ComEA
MHQRKSCLEDWLDNEGMRFARALAVCLIVSSVVLAADKPRLPDGKGKETMQRICSSCHGPEIVLGRQLARDGWEQVVVNMVQRGAQGTDDEFADIVDYLTNTVSVEAAKINVNKATAKQLQAGLEISDKDADAILHYREEKGEFKSVDDLKKVPGIDAAKIDAKKSKLTF